MITRRQSLAMTVGAVTTAMVARARSSLAPGSLHELAKLKGMRFGSTMPLRCEFSPQALTGRHRREPRSCPGAGDPNLGASPWRELSSLLVIVIRGWI
jgi:hypothetical protein